MGTLREDLCTFVIISRYFFLEREILQQELVKEIETHILCSIQKSCSLWDNVEEKYGAVRGGADGNIKQLRKD
jgi:hypothetical protein